MMFGSEQADWDELTRVGEEFLIERARLGRLTSYTELNATLARRTSLRPFDFGFQADRAAMGHLLGLIVQERKRSANGLMISALVIYLDGNDAGSGFYKLAQDLGDLPPGQLAIKAEFWTTQVSELFSFYRGSQPRAPFSAIHQQFPQRSARSSASRGSATLGCRFVVGQAD